MFSTFSHRRSCSGCVKAKRRCDRRIPQCTRCIEKAALCVYENPPLRQSRADLVPSSTGAGSLMLGRSHNSEDSTNYPSTLVAVDESAESQSVLPVHSNRLDLGYELSLPEIKWRNSKVTICCLASRLQEFPTAFINKGRTPFIHHQLYSKHSPHQIQEAFYVCEIVSHNGGHDPETQLSILEPKLEELKLENDRTASFDDLLASVQALMLYLVICLFNNSPDLRRCGEQYCHLLDVWTRNLRDQAPAELSHSLSPWQAWYFAESVRRSILVSHMIRAVYATIKQGYHIHTLYVEALPFDPQTLLWDAQSASDWTTCTSSTHP